MNNFVTLKQIIHDWCENHPELQCSIEFDFSIMNGYVVPLIYNQFRKLIGIIINNGVYLFKLSTESIKLEFTELNMYDENFFDKLYKGLDDRKNITYDVPNLDKWSN